MTSKTTILGILTIIATLAGAAVQFIKTGTCDLSILTAGVTAGIGLIKSADATPAK
jgi:hypothetical protein